MGRWLIIETSGNGREFMKNGNGKRPRRLPEILTEDEQARLLAVLDGDDPSSTRGRAIVRVLVDTGLLRKQIAWLAGITPPCDEQEGILNLLGGIMDISEDD